MAVATRKTTYAPGEAYSTGGVPATVPLANAFDYYFGQPFQAVSDWTPPEQVLPLIEDSRPIFVDNATDRTLTYGQIRTDGLRFSAGLHSLGHSPSNIIKLPPTPSCPAGPEIAPVVLIQLPNSLAFAPVLLGAFASGLTATLVSPGLTADEVSWILQNAKPVVIITATACLGPMKEALSRQEDQAYFGKVPIYTFDAANDTYPLPAKQGAINNGGMKDWKELLISAPKERKQPFAPSTAEARTAVILWSSGTSGRSKGVLLSHHALNFSCSHLWHDADYWKSVDKSTTKGPKFLGYVPFYHVFGLSNVMLLAICSGATVYVMPQFSLDGMLAAIPKRQVTYLHMAPPIAVMLAKAPNVEKYAKRDPVTGKNAFSSIVASVTGGAPLGHEVVVEVYKRCGFRIRLGYGLSETCSTSLQRGYGQQEMDEQAGDTGSPHWGVELMIASGEPPVAGQPTQPAKIDQEGEVLIRSPTLMSAYLPVGLFSGKTPDLSVTNEALTPDGWFRTGDVGALNAAGRLRITDRLKELIKVRAYQVAPAELEAVLCSSENVADAGVVGVYDESEATEWPRAYVVARTAKTQEELAKLAQELKELVEKRTTKYKWLVGGLVFVEKIPKSPSGKILRRVLKAGGPESKGVEFVLYQPKRRGAAKQAKL